MTRDDIIRMAQEAGLYHFYDSEGQCTGITNARLVTEDKERDDDRLVEMLAPFTALVAAAEREACAKTAEQELLNTNMLMSMPPKSSAAWNILNAIRARSNT